jgi:hypothetical protein
VARHNAGVTAGPENLTNDGAADAAPMKRDPTAEGNRLGALARRQGTANEILTRSVVRWRLAF